MQLLVTADCLRVVDEQTKVSDMYFFVVSINSIEIRCVKWMMSCTLRSDIIWLSPKLKSGLQYCLCALMAVTLESFLQFYFFLLPRCYSAMRVKAWNYKLQIVLQNLKSVLPYINNTEYRSKVDVRLNGSSDSSLILVYCYFDRFFGT